MKVLGYAILEELARAPQTGYRLARRIQVPIGYMWTSTHSQIYPALAELENAGLVRHRVIEGRGPRDTKRYAITRSGRTTLRKWIDSPLEPQPARSELMLRVRGLWLVSPGRALQFLTRIRLEHERRLADYRSQQEELQAEQPRIGDEPTSPTFFAYATLIAGISYEQQLVEWIDWLAGVLRSQRRHPRELT